MHDLLYKNWKQLNSQKIMELADRIDLDMSQFKNNLEQREFRNRVATELKEGISYGVEKTTTFFYQ